MNTQPEDYKYPEQQQQQQPQQPQQPVVVVQHPEQPEQPRQYSTLSKVLLYISVIIPPIPVIIVATEPNDIFINLCLLFLFGVGALFHSIYIVYKYTSGEKSYGAWVKKYGHENEKRPAGANV